MFLFSKLVWLLAQPLSLGFFLSALAAILGLARLRRTAALAALLAASILFVTLYTTTGAYALQALENRIARQQDPASLSCMIVLGGAFENEVTTSRGGIEFNQAGDRFIEALRLAQKYPHSRILISGGDGSFSGVYEGEAQASERFFTTFGISPDRIIKENSSRTTYENTRNTTGLLKAEGLSDCALITSAFHMPRATALFARAGIAVIAWPTDYRTSGKVAPGFDFTQPSSNAQLSGTALREWMAIAGYYLAGRIDGISAD